jgi:RNA polymerase sigma-70 factor (ECF subfamily)
MGIFMGGTVSNLAAAGNHNSRHPTAGSLIYGLPAARIADRFRSGLAATRAAPGQLFRKLQRMMNKTSDQTSKPPMGSVGPVVLDESEPDDDALLVTRAQGGDMRSYDTLVTRHRGRIFAMIRNMIHQEAEAWDLAQEVFIKAWQALPRFEAKARFSTWLYRIAHNVVYDWTRKKRIEGVGELNDEIFERDQIDPASATTPDTGVAPDEAMSRGELRLKIEAALAKLSPEHREVVVLKDVQGLAYKEIAEVMGSSIGTVMSRLFYDRQKLQTMLKHEYESR